MTAAAGRTSGRLSVGAATNPRAERVYRPGPAERDPVGTSRRRGRLELALGTGVPIVVISLWQLAGGLGWMDTRVYPAPDMIARAAIDMVESGDLWDAFRATAFRVIVGWSIGVGLGFIAGVAMGASRWTRKALEPLTDALYVVPKLALLPLFITIFGLGEGPKIALVAVTVFFFVWIATMAAVMAVPLGYRDTARVFGASRAQMFRHVTLQAILPQVFVSMRVGAGVAVLVIVAAEFIVGNSGLGYIIFNSRAIFLNDRMYVGIVAVAIFGVAFAEVVRRVGRYATRWAPESRPDL